MVAIVVIFVNRLKIKSMVYKIEYVKLPQTLESKFEGDINGRFLAKGAFGKVTTVRHTNGGVYAAKYIRIDRPGMVRTLT